MDGIILINKPKGCTSHDVIYKVKKIFHEKVGHTGTLDPMATGVLPLLVGKGTLCSKYLINHDKKYQVVLELGAKTSTADAEGEIIEKCLVNTEMLDEENIKHVLKPFIGKQEQIPPMYSAIKVNGKKLYEYARKGQKVEIKPRQIEIYEIHLLGINKELKQISFEVSCSKGTYIRSLCEDVAKAMNSLGFMKELNRIQVGDFKIEDTITLEELNHAFENAVFGDTSVLHENAVFFKCPQIHEKTEKKFFITIEELFSNSAKIKLDNKKLQLFLNGVKLSFDLEDGNYRIYRNNMFVGIGVVENGLLKRDIILHEIKKLL